MSSVGFYENLRRQKYDEFCKLAEQRGGKVQSPLGDYQNRRSKLQVQCSATHLFEIDFHHLAKRHQWCRKCRTHFCEAIAVAALSYFLERPFEKVKPEWLRYPKTNSLLELDGYNDELKLGIEMNGSQHSEFTPFFHRTPTALQEQQERDQWKYQRCSDLAIYLLIVPHTIKPQDVPHFLAVALKEIGFTIDTAKFESFNFSHLPQPQSMQKRLKEIVAVRNGEILSALSNIQTQASMVELKCQEGHIWSTKVKYIVMRKSWCHRCGQQQPKNKKKVQKSKAPLPKTERLLKQGASIKAFYATEKGQIVLHDRLRKRAATMAKARKTLRKNIRQKFCKTCKKTLAIERFSKQAKSKDGYQADCKGCSNARQRELRRSKSSRFANKLVQKLATV